MKKSDMKNFVLPKPVVLVGMPGAGKSKIGIALAEMLTTDFIDADRKIEEAADLTVADIFAKHGEQEFRRLERDVIARLLKGGACVLSLGGGAFINAETRANIKRSAISVWLKVHHDLLVARVERRDNRPLLQGDNKREKIAALQVEREPIYAGADVTVLCDDRPVAENARRVREAIEAALASQTH